MTGNAEDCLSTGGARAADEREGELLASHRPPHPPYLRTRTTGEAVAGRNCDTSIDRCRATARADLPSPCSDVRRSRSSPSCARGHRDGTSLSPRALACVTFAGPAAKQAGNHVESPLPYPRFLALASFVSLSVSSPALAADADHPTVVELYQSQGCSSCPPANAVLNSVADRPDVLALSFAVTYWDRLGWKDIFAQPAYTAKLSASTSGRSATEFRTALAGGQEEQPWL